MRTIGPVCALLAVVAVSGCSGGSKSPAASPPTSVSPSGSSSIPSVASPTTDASPTIPPTPVSPPASEPKAAACTTSTLRLALGAQGAAAGTLYQTLVFTNTGTTSCSVLGYPGVSFLDAAGNQLGKPARRDSAEKPHRVTLSPGEKAHAVVGMPQATACQEAESRAIRVYPPGQTESLHAQWHQQVCTNDEARPSVGPLQPGKTS